MLQRTLAFAFLTVWSGTYTAPLTAQEILQPVTQVETDKVDSRTYGILFRRENAYMKVAKAASSPDSPDAQLSIVLPTLLKLNSAQAASLEHFAGAWEAEIAPLRSQMMAAIAAFHNSFPNGRLNSGVDPTPPAAISNLRAQIDTVTLRYRDQLRNTMLEPAFQEFETTLRESFGKNVGAAAARRDLVMRGLIQ